MVSENALFGYGSLILPTSLVARFEDDIPDVSPIYEEGRNYGDPELIRDKAEEAWRSLLGDINAIPVKIEGFQRAYSSNSPRGGAMLGIKESSNHFVNGVVYTGLSNNQIKKISHTEPGYRKMEVESERIEPYISKELMAEMGVELPETVEIFDPAAEEPEADSNPNEVYHDRVKTGAVDYIEDMYGKEVRIEFWNDFITSTRAYSALHGRTENPNTVMGLQQGIRWLLE